MGPAVLAFAAFALVGLAASSSPKGKPGAKPIGGGSPAGGGPIGMATPPNLLGGGGANKWGIKGCDPFHTPTGSNQAPTPGVQSDPDYQWCFVVPDGSTPGDVAAMVLGPDQSWRYVELLTANPEKATKGSVVAPDAGDEEMNFVQWKVGETVRLPRTWNPWIDQVGSPRGETAPYMPPGYGYGAAA